MNTIHHDSRVRIIESPNITDKSNISEVLFRIELIYLLRLYLANVLLQYLSKQIQRIDVTQLVVQNK